MTSVNLNVLANHGVNLLTIAKIKTSLIVILRMSIQKNFINQKKDPHQFLIISSVKKKIALSMRLVLVLIRQFLLLGKIAIKF